MPEAFTALGCLLGLIALGIGGRIQITRATATADPSHRPQITRSIVRGWLKASVTVVVGALAFAGTMAIGVGMGLGVCRVYWNVDAGTGEADRGGLGHFIICCLIMVVFAVASFAVAMFVSPWIAARTNVRLEAWAKRPLLEGGKIE